MTTQRLHSIDRVRSHRISRRLLLFGGGAAAATAAISSLRFHESSFAQGTLPQGPATPNAIGPAVPPELEQYANDWPAAQANLQNTRANPSATIDASNVGQLQVAWSFPIQVSSAFGGMTATPLIVGDTVYIQDMQSNVFALARDSGNVKWKHEYNAPTEGPNGVAIGYGMIYGSTGDNAQVFALDAQSGDEVWRIDLTNNDGEGIDMTPAVYGNVVYISTVPGNSKAFYRGGTKGVIFALDAKTGTILWTFDTTTDNLWGNPQVNTGGGAWYPPAVDEAGNLYFDIANPGPWPGVTIDGTPYPNGSTRPGPNDYTNSAISLGQDGSLRWYYNAAPHDLFDHDMQQSPILADISNGGTTTKLVFASGKLGKVVALEADSGEMVWTTKVGKHNEWDDTQAIPPGQTIEVLPGAAGGVESPIAYADGTIFVPILDLATKFTGTEIDLSSVNFANGTGELVALNAADGTVKWQVDFPKGNVGGATVANGVVFTGTLDGVVHAHDTGSGKELWTYQASAGINAPAAVAGDLLLVPAAGPFFGSSPGGQAKLELLASKPGAASATPAAS